MKHSLHYSIILFLFLAVRISAQIPNAGFESWSGGAPEGWITNNIPSVGTPITQVSTAHSGTSALKGAVVDVFSSPMNPLLQLKGGDGNGAPVTQRYGQLTGYYKFTPQGGDKMAINCYMSIGAGQMGAGVINITTAAAGFTKFVCPISYEAPDVPDHFSVNILISGSSGQAHIGSYFILDDLVLEGASAVGNENAQILNRFSLDQNYPNPFNPSTVINYTTEKRGQVQLKVYNMLGNEVATIVNNEQEAGIHTATFSGKNLASGMYIYELKSGSKLTNRKMLLIK